MRLISTVIFSSLILFTQLPAASYHVRNKVTISNTHGTFSRISVIMPVPQSNQYQTVSGLNVNGGTVLAVPQTVPVDSYIRWSPTTGLPAAGQQKDFYYEFDVTINAFIFDFTRVTSAPPYDSASNLFTWYTGANGAYVDPGNAAIKRIGDSLWASSAGVVDYGRRCYVYVAQNYRYLNPNTGLHPLADILASGGGDCGNLSSIWVSLMRYRKIPARHVVTIRPNATFHVWSEFYIESFGWIPVDVTAKQSSPSGDFYGKYADNGIVMNRAVNLQLEKGDGSIAYAPLLQSYYWWYWGSGSAQSGYSLTSAVIPGSGVAGIPNPSIPGVISLAGSYPNPFHASTRITAAIPLLTGARSPDTRLAVFSITGEQVAVLHAGTLDPGVHAFTWNGRDGNGRAVAAGRYLIRMQAGKFSHERPVTLNK